MSPPMWFLGAYEMAAGGVIADLPRTRMTPRQANNDRLASALYRERRGQFPALARRAGLAVGLTFAGCRRRLHVECAAPAVARRRAAAGLPAALAAGRPARQRAPPPGCGGAGRLLLHAGGDVAQQHASTDAGVRRRGGLVRWPSSRSPASNVQQGGGASPRLLSMQPLLYGALLVGFRHVIRVPAELRANWGFQLAWRGRDRAFLAGVEVRRRRGPRRCRPSRRCCRCSCSCSVHNWR